MIYCHLCQPPPPKKKNWNRLHFKSSLEKRRRGSFCFKHPARHRCRLLEVLALRPPQEPSPRLGWTRHLSCSPSSPRRTDPLTSAGFTSSRGLMPLPDVIISVLQPVCFRATLESNILLTGVKGLITGKRRRHDNKGQSLWWRNAEVLSLLVSYLLQRLPRWHYAQPTSATGTLRSVTFSMYATALWGFFFFFLIGKNVNLIQWFIE